MDPSVAHLARPLPGDPVEEQIARDLARHGALVAPAVVLAGGLVAGAAGAVAAALALGVVVANFLLAATLLSGAARLSPTAVGAAALGGYVARLGVLALVAVALRTRTWLHFPTFLIVLVVAHLGLLVWELRSVSLSLAAPGLRPAPDTQE